MPKVIVKLVLLIVFVTGAGYSAVPAQSPSWLDTGYDQMYNLQFGEAHRSFAQWQQLHPDDPMGPVSDAAAYLFSEFNRLHILELQFFTDDDAYENRSHVVPDPSAKAGFDRDMASTEQLADRRLAQAPDDANALLAKVMAAGLQGDYLALIERRDLAGLRYIKTGRTLAQQLLQTHPTCYDAYLAIGAENYLLGIEAAPVRWFLHLTGAQTDKSVGIEDLRFVAQKGHYLAPYARLLLAIAALRDKDNSTARQLLSGLAREFPQNPLYRKELDKLE